MKHILIIILLLIDKLNLWHWCSEFRRETHASSHTYNVLLKRCSRNKQISIYFTEIIKYRLINNLKCKFTKLMFVEKFYRILSINTKMLMQVCTMSNYYLYMTSNLVNVRNIIFIIGKETMRIKICVKYTLRASQYVKETTRVMTSKLFIK